MPRKISGNATDFGERLTTLRKAAGFTQVELANELAVTQRMISYYESHAEHPPANLIPRMAKALGISADELLGIKPVKKTRQPDNRLQRRFQQIEKMDAKEKRRVMQLLDTFIENKQLKRNTHG